MNRTKIMLILLLCFPVFSFAQRCLSEIMFQEQAKKDPTLIKNRQLFEEQLTKYVDESKNYNKTTATPRIIPVVFHIIYEGSEENISKAQIEDQIRILNEDFRKLNADAANVPTPFKSVAADCNIEFRLAHKDPNGNCTDGIIRVFSPLTNGPNNPNDVKALSYWNSSMYLNVWVVKNINYANTNGELLGYAQFPDQLSNAPKWDGIVVRSDYIGSIGTATTPFNGQLPNGMGRVATHEIGHWLALRHIWGDGGSQTCVDDGVNDTPIQEKESSGCPTFPHVSCVNGPNGDMFDNYMDYTDGRCMNIFTTGQKSRMDGVFAVTRQNIISSSNNIATGTNTTTSALCAPKADFSSDKWTICAGDSITFTDISTNADATSWSWTFQGGTPATSTSKNPLIHYNTEGTYDVSFTAKNATGSTTKTVLKYVYVNNTTRPAPYSEGFEGNFPNSDWTVTSIGKGNTWQKITTASYSGTSSLYINNYDNPEFSVFTLMSPTIDFTTITNDVMTFRYAYAQKTSISADRLILWASADCGATWTIQYNKYGAGLSTAGIKNLNFVPNSPTQWKEVPVPIALYKSKNNVRFKFEFTTSNGNNIYIDDINITGTVGIENETEEKLNLTISPNPIPLLQGSVVSFNLTTPSYVNLKIYDVLGREVTMMVNQKLDVGFHQYALNKITCSGIYFLKITTEHITFTKKIIVD